MNRSNRSIFYGFTEMLPVFWKSTFWPSEMILHLQLCISTACNPKNAHATFCRKDFFFQWNDNFYFKLDFRRFFPLKFCKFQWNKNRHSNEMDILWNDNFFLWDSYLNEHWSKQILFFTDIAIDFKQAVAMNEFNIFAIHCLFWMDVDTSGFFQRIDTFQ